jgi:8-oxo-dGTP pyrophosphatase MutT (NUDIX family)
VIDQRLQVLLRRPPGDFDGYVWTFPKGSAAAGEDPVDAAARQVTEETGWVVTRPTRLPGQFRGGTRYSEYHVFAPAGPIGPPDPTRTRAICWAAPDEAARLIGETRNELGRERDLAVLAAAVGLAERHRGFHAARLSRPPTRAEADDLLAYRPGFERPDRTYTTWQSPPEEGGVSVMPYPTYDPDVVDFYAAAGQDHWTDFSYRPVLAGAMMVHAPLVDSCDIDQLKTMLTYCVRGEKFCDGYWGVALGEGKIQALLSRLATLRNALAEG